MLQSNNFLIQNKMVNDSRDNRFQEFSESFIVTRISSLTNLNLASHTCVQQFICLPTTPNFVNVCKKNFLVRGWVTCISLLRLDALRKFSVARAYLLCKYTIFT